MRESPEGGGIVENLWMVCTDKTAKTPVYNFLEHFDAFTCDMTLSYVRAKTISYVT